MKTRSGWFHLRSLFLLSAAFAVGSSLCSTAVAGPMTYRESNDSRPHMAQNTYAQKTMKFYVLTSASAIPKPISYVIGGLMTTAVPIQIIGRGTNVTR
ncbi:MAG: hypothetical protein ACR2G0_00710 [Chthoniobacterales bacterium]